MSTTSDTAKPWSVTYAKSNFLHLCRLIVEGGTRVLQEVLDNIHPPEDLESFLAKETIKAKLGSLPNTMYRKVYPEPGTYGKSKDFDITLLCRLLRDSCNLRPPATGWDNEPLDADDSLSADVVRIRKQRNKLAHSGVEVEIQDEDFYATWKNMQAILTRLARSVSVNNATKWTKNIDEMLKAPLTADEERYTKELKIGYLEDMKSKEEMQSVAENVREILHILKTKNQPQTDEKVLTNEVERLLINLLEESKQRKELEELQQDIFLQNTLLQDIFLQEKKDLEDKLDQLRSELSSEKDKREAAENAQIQEKIQLVLSRERAEREYLQVIVREKEEEARRLQRELEAAQSRSRGGDSDERQSWELRRDDINLSDHELGRGGWAVVKKAVFRGCPVAVKQLYGEILSQYNLGLFQREMSIASKCRHPCLLQFIGATTDEKPLIVTELLDTSLRTLLQQRSLQGKEAVVIALDVARALNYLHLHIPPIIHRDVSSANTLLWLRGSSYRAKVSDYGTANFMMACKTTNPGAVVYSAPEAESRSSQSTKLDVYSYGVLLCEMFTREFPSPHDRERQVSLVTDDDIASVIKACLREEPAERPDMNGVIEVLRRIASNRGLGEI